MKWLMPLAIAALIPALSHAGPWDAPYGADFGNYYPPAAESYELPRYAPGPVPGDSESLSDTPSAPVFGSRGNGRLWVPAPPLASPQGNDSMGFPNDRGIPYPSPYAGPGLYEQFRPGAMPRMEPRVQGAPVGMENRWKPAAEEPGGQYLFRNGDRLEMRPGMGGSDYRGYRFRPLTEQERERTFGVSGWRPVQSGSFQESSSPYAVTPPERKDAYGYRSEGWFGRYFDDQRR